MYNDRHERDEGAVRIVAAICDACDYPLDRFLLDTTRGQGRKPVGATQSRSEVQRIACALLRERNFSLPEIARAIGLRDHTTVMHHLRQRLTRFERDLLDMTRTELDNALMAAYRRTG